MKTYQNKVIINGESFTHEVKAASYKEALQINKQRKIDAAKKSRKIIGRLEKVNNL